MLSPIDWQPQGPSGRGTMQVHTPMQPMPPHGAVHSTIKSYVGIAQCTQSCGNSNCSYAMHELSWQCSCWEVSTCKIANSLGIASRYSVLGWGRVRWAMQCACLHNYVAPLQYPPQLSPHFKILLEGGQHQPLLMPVMFAL